MANAIELFKQYVPLLDEVYKTASTTADLDGDNGLATWGATANELVIPMMDMSGLRNYDRASGYKDGKVTLTSQTKACNFDRGTMFYVDTLDNAETAGLAYGRLASEFIRTKVVPELDAFRYATYAQVEGVGKATGTLATGKAVVEALRTAIAEMDDAEVPMEGRVLKITSPVLGLIQDMDTTASREVLARFTAIQVVPQTRFYTAIEQLDTEVGGYTKATGGAEINFMILHKSAVIQYQKHVAPKVIEPQNNPKGDGWSFGYRNVGIAEVYKNKTVGIYVHAKA